MMCAVFSALKGVLFYEKINGNNSITFKEGFEAYINNCKVRNLREGTIKHYNECYKSITRFIDEDSI
ncbi:hypothetical protein [Clostridium sp.]|uniref:hypothetical protein n=1 Tax=Clostridium sp. TaxID=1506 RepID=UPI003995CC3B